MPGFQSIFSVLSYLASLLNQDSVFSLLVVMHLFQGPSLHWNLRLLGA